MNILYQRLITTINEEEVGTTEYHIAGRMIENASRLYQITIGEMAEICDVSKSTVSKFVRRIGFDDYSDFKLEAVRERKKEVYIKGQDTINITDFMHDYGKEAYLQALETDIRNLFLELDKDKIDKLVEAIHDYSKIASFGEIYSETAALNFQYKMSYYRKFIYTTINGHRQEKYIEQADENTLIIVFSNSGRYINSFPTLEGEPEKDCFYKTKARVVLITSHVEMEKDAKVDMCICYRHSQRVQNHPVLYQLIIEQIALRYQEKYGFPVKHN